MTVRNSHYKKQFFLSLLILICISTFSVFSQKSLTGNLNQPKSHVTAVGTDRITVDNVSRFIAGDTVLLIQMQGVKIQIAANAFGNLQDIYGEPGMHEFLIISSVITGTKEIVFSRNIKQVYDVRGNIQVIRVPYYYRATVTGALTVDAWNPATKTGGVLAIIVGRTLKLNKDIDVSGLGFRGGMDTLGQGICFSVDENLYKQDYYGRNFKNAGYKGEGVANYTEFNQPLYPNYVKGKGPAWNGGGGGNGRFSGGGGGGNLGLGGIGGYEDYLTCNPLIPAPPGDGGFTAVHSSVPSGIFLGGGGGASTRTTAGGSSGGGHGGGIVIIVTDTLIGNGGNIISNGSNGSSITGTGGSGGGGAGGSIALSLNSYGSTAVKFSLQGGRGGDSPAAFGEGGGGGGGLLYVSTSLTNKVDTTFAGGRPGNDPTSTATHGNYGKMRPNFKANLNGFLFNSIRSSVTGNQADSVCFGSALPKITGTKPVGGTPAYDYLWEKSYNKTTWLTLTNDADPVNYTPTPADGITPTDTVWFRRTITDHSSPTIITDVSKPVKITVHPKILNNSIVASPDTICSAGDPKLIKQKLPDLVVPTTKGLVFTWQSSTDGTTWGANIVSGSTYKEYDPNPVGGLTLSTYYRRTVKSGSCTDITVPVRIQVLVKLSNNAFSKLNDTICYSGNTNLNTVSGPSGGLPTDYRYQWEQGNTSTGPWLAIPGGTGQSYDPDATVPLPVGNYYYRRIVYSGEQNACTDISTPALRKVWPVISGNAIQADQTICETKQPAKLTQLTSLSGGSGTYKAIWEYSTDNSTYLTAPSVNTSLDYQPPNLSVTTWYRRNIKSSACTNNSLPVLITVQPAIKNNSVALYSGLKDSTICSDGKVKNIDFVQKKPLVLAGGNGTYTYKWKYSTDTTNNSSWIYSGTSSGYIHTLPIGATTVFKRVVRSGTCRDSANSVRISVLPPIVNKIPVDKTVCTNSVSTPVMSVALSGGKAGQYKFLWESASAATGPWSNVTSDTIRTPSGAILQLPLLTTPVFYRRNVWSGPFNTCSSVSNNVNILIDQKPYPVFAGNSVNLISLDNMYNLQAVKPVLSDSTAWSVLSSKGNPDFDDVHQYNTVVNNLAQGDNILLWTVKNGVCIIDTTVNITVFNLEVPRGISPNGDFSNDSLIIKGLDFSLDENGKPYQLIELTILNSAGAQVYYTSNAPGKVWTPWDGKNSNGTELPDGTYYYLLNITSSRTNQFDKNSGYVILKRN